MANNASFESSVSEIERVKGEMASSISFENSDRFTESLEAVNERLKNKENEMQYLYYQFEGVQEEIQRITDIINEDPESSGAQTPHSGQRMKTKEKTR